MKDNRDTPFSISFVKMKDNSSALEVLMEPFRIQLDGFTEKLSADNRFTQIPKEQLKDMAKSLTCQVADMVGDAFLDMFDYQLNRIK